MMVNCFAQDLEIWSNALAIWNAFYIGTKPFIRLFDGWSCIQEIEDEFCAELLKTRLPVSEFLVKMQNLFAQVQEKDEIFCLILQAACSIVSHKKTSGSGWKAWLKRSTNLTRSVHGNSQLMNPIDFISFCLTETLHIPFVKAIEKKVNQVLDKTSEGQILFSLAFLRTDARKNTIQVSEVQAN
jgi:hypothetical protein